MSVNQVYHIETIVHPIYTVDDAVDDIITSIGYIIYIRAQCHSMEQAIIL